MDPTEINWTSITGDRSIWDNSRARPRCGKCGNFIMSGASKSKLAHCLQLVIPSVRPIVAQRIASLR